MPVTRLQGIWDFDPTEPNSTCIAFTCRKRRCRKVVRNGNPFKLDDLLNVLVSGTAETNIYQLLESYAKRNLCSHHQNLIPGIYSPIRQWAIDIDQKLEVEIRRSGWGALSFHQCSISEAVHTALSLLLQTGRTPSAFRSWSGHPVLSVEHLLCSPLQARDSKAGVLYLYSKKGRPGFSKIGMTSRTIRTRSWEIKGQCGYKPSFIYASSVISNVRRAEQLVFSELERFRRQETNCLCGIEHSEWFEMDAELAQRTVENWSYLFKEVRVYDKDGCITQNVRDVINDVLNGHKSITAEILTQHVERSMSLVPTFKPKRGHSWRC